MHAADTSDPDLARWHAVACHVFTFHLENARTLDLGTDSNCHYTW